jgi:chromosome partitioning protein
MGILAREPNSPYRSNFPFQAPPLEAVSSSFLLHLGKVSMKEKKYEKVIDRWEEIPTACNEAHLEVNLVSIMLESLGLSIKQIRINPNLGLGLGLIPDRLIYQDIDKPPVLVIEDKKRIPDFASATTDDDFINVCKRPNSLYRDAVGYLSGSNGIRQYLDKNVVPQDTLASYGLVFNGDFFQLWRRVDGLVYPLTGIQRFMSSTIPSLMRQLEYCLKNPQRALVTAVWNQKGGVAKTTNTINLGATLALEGKKVLLIDLDEQTDLTRGVGLNPENFKGWLQDCIDKVDKDELAEARNILKQTVQDRLFLTSDKKKLTLSVLPCHRDSIGKGFREKKDINHIKIFRRIIQLLSSDYDYIFIDASPAADVLSRCVLYSSDTTLIPIDYGKKSIHHGVGTYRSIAKLRLQKSQAEQIHIGPWNLGLVFSNCPPDSGTNLKKLIDDELLSIQFAGRQCKSVIKTYAQTKIAEFKHMPVICWQKSPVTECYKKLADEVFLNHNFVDE